MQGWRCPRSSGPSRLTVHPADAHAFKDGHEQETHAAGCIGVEELEDVHAALGTAGWAGRGRTWPGGASMAGRDRKGLDRVDGLDIPGPPPTTLFCMLLLQLGHLPSLISPKGQS